MRRLTASICSSPSSRLRCCISPAPSRISRASCSARSSAGPAGSSSRSACSSTLFKQLSALVSDAIYDGRLFDPAPRAAIRAIEQLAEKATGRVEFGAYKGSLFFQQLVDCPASLYNMADASMEASEGLNPTSSQGYVEVQSAEARALARAGQIVAPVWR